MSGSISKLANGAKCRCLNNDPLRFRRFHDRKQDEVLGLQCLECQDQYLKGTFLALVDDRQYFLQPGTEKFYLAPKTHIREDDVHMVHSAKTKVNNVLMFGDYLKPGDHIAWHRPLGHWHHAIVTEIGRNKVRVVHWYSNLGKTDLYIKIVEEFIDLKEQAGDLYRINYAEDIVKANPVRLVIARARSRIHERGYHPIKDNCETLASFCKFGVAISQQIVWACKELRNECTKSGVKTAAEVGFAEFTEGIVRQGQMVGLGFLVIIEGVLTCIDIKDVWKARKEGKMTKKVAIEQITERISQAVLGGTLAGLGGMVPTVGFVVGFCGGIVGKWFGTMLGPHIGRFTASLIEYDDKAICDIRDLRSGDHLILSYDSQESHHCIVQWYDEKTNKINIIHNTEKDGVNKDWIEFIEPVYKVIHDEKDCCSPHDAWEQAVSMLGTQRYNTENFNSKHFAQACYKKH